MELLGDIPFDRFISSTAPRAIDTIKPLAEAQEKEIETYQELLEIQLRDKDHHLSDEQVESEIKKLFEDYDYKLPGGQCCREVADISGQKLRELLQKYEGKTIALGTHGMVMTLMFASFDSSFGFAFWKATTKPDIYKAEFEDEKIVSFERIKM